MKFEVTVTDVGIEDEFELNVDWDGPGPDEPELFTFTVGEDGTETFEIEHEYLDDDPTDTPSDTHTVSFKLTDDDFGSQEPLLREIDVTVNNVEPVLSVESVSETTIDEGEELQFELTIEDPGIKDSFEVVVTWAPGEEETYSIAADDTSTHTLTVSRLYPDDDPTGTPSDTSSVTFKVEDDDTGDDNDDTDITVNNVDPEVEPIPDQGIPLNEPLPLTAAWDDVGVDDTHTHEWTFTHQATGASFADSGESIAPVFNRLGIWNATYTITDDDTGTDSVNFTVNVDDCFVDPFVVTAEIIETGTIYVSITADADRVDPANGTLEWGDGTIENFVLQPNTSLTLSRMVDDDDPTGTSADPYAIDISIEEGCSSITTSPTIRNEAPTISVVSAPSSVAEGDTATVVVAVSEISTADTLTAEIAWGDGVVENRTFDMAGTTSRNFTLTHIYQDEIGGGGAVVSGGGGSPSLPTTSVPYSTIYGAFIRVEDDDLGSDSVGFDIEVENAPPVLTVTPLTPLVINEQDTVTLQLDIADPGVLDTFRVFVDWDGPGGDPPEVRSAGPGAASLTMSHKYEDDEPSVSPQDIYNVRVAVQDDNGGVDADSVAVTVRNVDPVVTIDSISSTEIDEGQSVTIDVTVSEVSPLDTLNARIVWSPSDVQTLPIDLGGATTGSFSFTRTIDDDNPTGTPFDDTTISLTVRDDDSGSGSDTRNLRVNNVTPTVTVTPQSTSLVEGEELILDIEVVDPGVADYFDVQIDWGYDGQTSTIGIPAGGTTHMVTASLPYWDDNPSGTQSDPYTVHVVVTDDDTGVGNSTFNITVVNAPPQVASIGNRSAKRGEVLEFAGAFADIGIDDTHTHEWTFSHPSGTVLTRNDQVLSISFDEPGLWAGSYRVTDDDTDFDTATFTVDVAADPVVVAGGTTLNEGDEITIGLGAGAVVASRLYRVEIDWGDGRTDTLTRSGVDVADVYRHILADDIPTATVVDTSEIVGQIFDTTTGLMIQERTKGYTVNNVLPEITAITTDGAVSAGVLETLGVDFTDAGIDDTHTFTWNFGDGSAEVVTTTPNVQHAFTAGAFTVRVNVEDDDTGLASFSRTINTVARAEAASDSVASSVAEFASGDGVSTIIADTNETPMTFYEFLRLTREFGRQGVDMLTDLDGNGIVELNDLMILSRNFGREPDGGSRIVHAVADVGITNGSFDVRNSDAVEFGWTIDGPASVSEDGQGVLEEQGSFNARFSQTFIVPDGVTGLSFTVLSTELGATEMNPSDVFEVALLDAATMESVVDVATGLTLTDAALNIQHDGSAFFAPTVSGGGLTTSGQPTDLTVAANYTIDMTGVAGASELTLYFDLLGFGADDSRVVIDDVTLLTGPRPPVLSVSLADDFDSAELGDGLTNISPVTLVGLTDPDQQVLLDVDGDGFDDGTTTANSAGAYQFSDVPIALGTSLIQVQATNDVGTTMANVQVTLDNLSPVAELVAPAANETIASELGYVAIRWTDSGLAEFDTTSVGIDDVTIDGVTIDRVEARDESVYRYWYADDGDTLDDSLVQVAVINAATVDTAGNTSVERVFEFTIGSDQAPELEVSLAPEFDSAVIGDNLTNLTPVSIIGTTSPFGEVSMIFAGANNTTQADDQGRYRFDNVDITPGANSVRVETQNAFATTSRTLDVTLDNESPVIELVSPVPGTTITEDPGFVTLRISDPGPADLVGGAVEPGKVSLSGVEIDRVESSGAGLYRYYYDDESLVAGTLQLNVESDAASDTAGNVSIAYGANFTLSMETSDGPVFYGPEPYLQVSDTPNDFYKNACDGCVVLEDFEDNSLDFRLNVLPGSILPPGASSGTPNITDSVDEDDGVVDGTGQTGEGGYSWYNDGNHTVIEFANLVTAAGVVWTDGDFAMRHIRFEAKDQSGVSLGFIDAGDLSDDSYQGTTDEDRFFGVRWGDGLNTGISSILLSSTGGRGVELDHIQFVQPLVGDFNLDQRVDALDIDLLAAAIRNDSNNPIFDISNDTNVSVEDLDLLVRDILHTRRGDTNLDGIVDHSDFLALSMSFGQNAGWADGNFGKTETVGFADFLELSKNFGKLDPGMDPDDLE